MQDRGVQILDVEAVFDGGTAEFIAADYRFAVLPGGSGITLPIKFRIENQALCAGTPDCMEATVGAAAQDVVTPSQRAATHFDAGSFSQPVELVIEKIATDGKNVVCHMTDLQQFDDCYNIRVTPNIPLNEGHFARCDDLASRCSGMEFLFV